MLGLSLLEEDRKRTAKNLENRSTYKYKEPKVKSAPTIKEVPEIVDESNFNFLLSEYRTECVSTIVALVVMLLPAVLILWAVYSTYDPKNSTSDFITIAFTLAGLVYGGVVIHTTFKSINTSMENLSLVKERYSGPELPKKKSKAKWLLLLLIPLFVALCVIISSKEDAESANDYNLPPTSYTQSANSNNSSGITKRINTESAMTKEQAERLRGTGYNGTRPNSSAEALELKAAQVKCKKCGIHTLTMVQTVYVMNVSITKSMD